MINTPSSLADDRCNFQYSVLDLIALERLPCPPRSLPLIMSSPNLNGTLGTLEVGVLVAIYLFGVASVQAYVYYTQSTEDSKLLKGLV